VVVPENSGGKSSSSSSSSSSSTPQHFHRTTRSQTGGEVIHPDGEGNRASNEQHQRSPEYQDEEEKGQSNDSSASTAEPQAGDMEGTLDEEGGEALFHRSQQQQISTPPADGEGSGYDSSSSSPAEHEESLPPSLRLLVSFLRERADERARHREEVHELQSKT
jgi:hypothetical protein